MGSVTLFGRMGRKREMDKIASWKIRLGWGTVISEPEGQPECLGAQI